MKIVNFKDVAEYQLCTGCGLCAYLYPEKIKMIDCVEFGRRPKFLNDNEEEFKNGVRYCPGVTLDRGIIQTKRKDCIKSLYDEWGPILRVYEGHSTDDEIRFKGSSGGAISALSVYCLEQRNFDGVLHVKAKDHEPALNTTELSLNREEILSGTGSRYSPASPCEKLSLIQQLDNPSVVVGKPCDIAATVSIGSDDSALRSKVGLTIACFCAGTPSTRGTFKMLEHMNISLKNLTGLRYRGHGWPGLTYAIGKIGKEYFESELKYDQSWGNILQKYRQWRCYICPDHTGEFADIAIGDPWYKEVADDDLGQSLILARTQQGIDFIDGAISSGYLTAHVVKPDLLPRSQRNLKDARAALWGRLLALKIMRAPCPNFTNFCLFSSWKTDLPLKEKIKSVLGTIKRMFLKNLRERQDLYSSYE